jgi:hypothetical protein
MAVVSLVLAGAFMLQRQLTSVEKQHSVVDSPPRQLDRAGSMAAAPPQHRKDRTRVSFRHPECYARNLGGCATRVNREHYISEGILELVEEGPDKPSSTVQVFGLAFQQSNAVQSLGVSGLTAKILCENHNTSLSPYDSAGKAMFLAMQSLDSAAGKPAAPTVTHRVDGDALERWMLKALFGGLYSGNFRVTPAMTMKEVCPPLELLEILFGRAAFPHRQGLYWMPPGAMITTDPQVLRFAPLIAKGDEGVIGLCVWFFGFEFILLIAAITPGEPTRFDSATYRPAGLRAVGSNSRIQFDWQDGAQSEEIVMRHE